MSEIPPPRLGVERPMSFTPLPPPGSPELQKLIYGMIEEEINESKPKLWPNSESKEVEEGKKLLEKGSDQE